MYLNLKKLKIYKAVRFYNLFSPGLMRFLKFLLFILSGITWIAFGISRITSLNLYFTSNVFSGLTYLFLPTAFFILFFEIFGKHLKNPKIKDQDNIWELLDFNSAMVLDKTLTLSKLLNEKQISTTSLILALLNYKPLKKVFFRIGLNPKSAKKEIERSLNLKYSSSLLNFLGINKDYSKEIQGLLDEANKIRISRKGEKIIALDLLTASFSYNQVFRQLIINLNLDQNDLKELSNWYKNVRVFRENKKKFWRLDNLLRKPPIGKDLTYGYSPYFDRFTFNLTEKVKKISANFKLMRRKKEVEQIEQILSKSGENNVLLVGEEGVGKDNVIEDFAEIIVKGKALPGLNYKKIFNLNISLIISSFKDKNKVQNTFLKLLDEASRAGNIILIINDFHTLVSESDNQDKKALVELLIPYLRSSNLSVIATTDPASFHKFIEGRGDLMRVFERVNVKEPSLAQTTKIIQEAIPFLENQSKLFITYGAIKGIVEGSDKYIRTSPLPEKALDLLSDVVSYASSNKKSLVTSQDVDEVITNKTGIPLGSISGDEKYKLENLEKLMHKEIVGQERAVNVVASAVRRLRVGLTKRGKPAGVFLFVGPTGVGKTLTSKILAKVYFGSKKRMLRFDMSEYQDVDSINRFLGSLKMNKPGQFTSLVKDNPFSLILLDEIEKASKNILNIFLQVFDEGHLTDVFGRKVSFEQNIIIATSNAGSGFIRDLVREGIDPSMEKEKIVDILIKEGHFNPEFINRFDEVVIFHPLSREQVYKISGILLNNLAKRLTNKGYIFKPTQEIVKYVSEKGYDPQFGARPMQRVIKDKIESLVAKKVLSGDLRKGVEFTLSLDEIEE